MTNKLLATALVLGLTAAYAQDKKPGPPKIDPKATAHEVELTQFNIEDGKKIYDMNCASCHGATGHGDGAASAALNPKPRDLSDGEYVNTRTWKELRDVIALGGANAGMSALMPAWRGALKNPQIDNVLAYVITLSKDAKKDDKPAGKAPAKK
jgi:mono/diheme cytochrome c family protein